MANSTTTLSRPAGAREPPPPEIETQAKTIEALIAPHVVNDGIVSRTVEVTPELAKRLLTYNLPGNRRTPVASVARLGRVLGTDKWRLNGEALKISVDNVLIDGQTRLKACIETGRPFITVMLFGLPTDAYDSLDQGRKRKVEDALARHGVPNAKQTAAAIVAVDAIRHRSAPAGGKWYGADADEAVDFITANPRISASVTATQSAAKLTSHSLLAAFHYHFFERSPEEADRFFADLGSGAGLASRDPVFVLRERLIEDMRLRAARRAPPNRWNAAAWIIVAWNHRRQRRPLRKFPQRALVSDAEGRVLLPDFE